MNNNNSDNYDENYMKIEFNSDDDLPLKTSKLRYMLIVLRSTSFFR